MKNIEGTLNIIYNNIFSTQEDEEKKYLSFIKSIEAMLLKQENSFDIIKWCDEKIPKKYIKNLINYFFEKKSIKMNQKEQNLQYYQMIKTYWDDIEINKKIQLFDNIFQFSYKIAFFILQKEKIENFYQNQIPYVFLIKINVLIKNFAMSALEFDYLNQNVTNIDRVVDIKEFAESTKQYFQKDENISLFKKYLQFEIEDMKYENQQIIIAPDASLYQQSVTYNRQKNFNFMDTILYHGIEEFIQTDCAKKIKINFDKLSKNKNFLNDLNNFKIDDSPGLLHKKIFSIEEQLFIFDFMTSILKKLLEMNLEKKLQKEKDIAIQNILSFLPYENKFINQILKNYQINLFEHQEIKNFSYKIYLSLCVYDKENIENLIGEKFYQKDIKKYCELNDRFFEQIKPAVYKKISYIQQTEKEKLNSCEQLWKFLLIYAYQKVSKYDIDLLDLKDKMTKVIQKELNSIKENYILNEKEMILENLLINFSLNIHDKKAKKITKL